VLWFDQRYLKKTLFKVKFLTHKFVKITRCFHFFKEFRNCFKIKLAVYGSIFSLRCVNMSEQEVFLWRGVFIQNYKFMELAILKKEEANDSNVDSKWLHWRIHCINPCAKTFIFYFWKPRFYRWNRLNFRHFVL
jgi:hypothetical protein